MRVNTNETLVKLKQPEIMSEKSRGLNEVSENKRTAINESDLRELSKDMAKLIDSQPTVANAWRKYWLEKGVNNIDGYRVQVTTQLMSFIESFSPNPQVEYEYKTLSAFDYVVQNDPNHFHPKVFNKNVPLSSSESKNILSKLDDFKLPEYQKELQDHYFEEQTGRIKNFAKKYPEIAVIAAINKGMVQENSMHILSSVESGNGEVLLPNLGPYKSSSLVMLRDNDSKQSLLISMNPLKTGSNVFHFDNNTKMQRFFKNEKNEEFIQSHFNLYDLQDGVFVKGAKTHLDNVQHGRQVQSGFTGGSLSGIRSPSYKWEPALDMEFTSFSQLNDKYGNEYVNRLKTQFTNNADVFVVSDSERKTKLWLERAKPIVDGLSIAISPFFPAAGVGGGLLSGIGIPIYQALTAYTQSERDAASFEVLTNLLLEGVTNIPVVGVRQTVRAAPKLGGELPSFRPAPFQKLSLVDKINLLFSKGLSGDPGPAAEFLRNGKRSDVIAQNANQSGDSNGVAVALLANENHKLIFMTSPSDKKGHDTLRYYQSMGVPKEQIQIVNVTKSKPLPADFSNIGGITELRLKPGQSAEPNQVYQNLAGSRMPNEQEAFFSRFENYDGFKNFLETSRLDKPSDVGRSTKQVTNDIKGGDPIATQSFFARNWKAYENGPSISVARRTAINQQVDDVYDAILKQVGPGKEFEGVSLVWSRGLNNSEYDSVLKAGQKLKKKNKPVTDEDVQATKSFETLNALKRNPHHLMTPQLYETIRTVNNNKKILTIPVGDPIEFAPYSRALKGEERAYYLNNSEDPLNLIQYWNRPNAPQGRYEQGVFLQQLFKKLNGTGEGIPMQQVGLRSGEMEKGAYMGIPTLYLEENNAFSGGARLLPLTTGGIEVQRTEHAFGSLSKETITAWEDIQTMEKSIKNMDSRLHNMKKATNQSTELKQKIDALENDIQALKNSKKEKEDTFIKGSEQISESQLNASLFGQTDWAATKGGEKGGLPHFMRENLNNLVGINAAKSEDEVRLIKNWLDEKLLGTPDSELPPLTADLLGGTMTSLEIDMLGEFLENLKLNYSSYKRSYLPS
ncbi:hypothetical protein CSB62_23860 [Vibrio splendidus]|uniref:Uncharacterized protein n=2 Tax=Vibrio lentus TaxID=136468 RepID=A0A855ITC9_9VIBR|nr:hypothetical protein CSB62_23860 [Vibrio splendidus]PMF05106.1 hypothetical protein BCV23_24785 [Vibrio lentus]PMG67956.1 hypothetical protein BCU87_25270 [Vibrio lentus]PMG70375.1 hypothetical protein BCU85_23945 [Vibrio lentus]PMG97017.1 hypothetical protein BCU78_24490 [Vibrio lentus]